MANDINNKEFLDSVFNKVDFIFTELIYLLEESKKTQIEYENSLKSTKTIETIETIITEDGEEMGLEDFELHMRKLELKKREKQLIKEAEAEAEEEARAKAEKEMRAKEKAEKEQAEIQD